jgi:hypothetical protein
MPTSQGTRRRSGPYSVDVAIFVHPVSRPTHTAPRGFMASSKKVIRKSSQQKAHALRMLLTSGVIRSAEIDPPGMGTSHAQMSPSRTLSPGRSVYGNSGGTLKRLVSTVRFCPSAPYPIQNVSEIQPHSGLFKKPRFQHFSAYFARMVVQMVVQNGARFDSLRLDS